MSWPNSWPNLVYFVRKSDGTGPIKIGCSCVPKLRVKQISCDMKLKLELLCEAKGGYNAERHLHAKFAHLRVTPEFEWSRSYPCPGVKEWFAPDPELLGLIAEIARTGAVGMADFKPVAPEVVALRNSGLSFAVIGARFGFSRQRAHQIFSEEAFKAAHRSQAA